MLGKSKLRANRSKGSAREKLAEAEIHELKKAFDLFDEGEKGTIEPAEIKKILQQLGLDRRNIVVFEIISELESTNSPVSFQQFLEVIYGRLGDVRSAEGLEKVFMLYDTEGRGVIDAQSIKRVAEELGETMTQEEILQMMHNTHILNKTESNQEFSFEEFYSIVTRKKY